MDAHDVSGRAPWLQLRRGRRQRLPAALVLSAVVALAMPAAAGAADVGGLVSDAASAPAEVTATAGQAATAATGDAVSAAEAVAPVPVPDPSPAVEAATRAVQQTATDVGRTVDQTVAGAAAAVDEATGPLTEAVEDAAPVAPQPTLGRPSPSTGGDERPAGAGGHAGRRDDAPVPAAQTPASARRAPAAERDGPAAVRRTAERRASALPETSAPRTDGAAAGGLGSPVATVPHLLATAPAFTWATTANVAWDAPAASPSPTVQAGRPEVPSPDRAPARGPAPAGSPSAGAGGGGGVGLGFALLTAFGLCVALLSRRLELPSAALPPPLFLSLHERPG
jgi:hypothetical protein